MTLERELADLRRDFERLRIEAATQPQMPADPMVPPAIWIGIIVSKSTTTTTAAPATTTTSGTTSSTTTICDGCSVTMWDVEFVDAVRCGDPTALDLDVQTRNASQTYSCIAPPEANFELTAGELVVIGRRAGEWWIIQKYGVCTIEQTTTTFVPPPPPCTGTCRWTWSTSNNRWSLTTDGCAKITTTSDPATTTTAGPDCECAYPTFCGSWDGECTQTTCQTGQSEHPANCPSTTSTTTTCNCNTTTTDGSDMDCTSNSCKWFCGPTGQWLQASNTCPNKCPCSAPPLTSCNPCDEYTGTCNTTTTPRPQIFCLGDCEWWWITGESKWVLVDQRCRFENTPCQCAAPSFDGTDCGPAWTPCEVPPQHTTTSTARPACGNCYEKTTTTPQITTTTGKHGCTKEGCVWNWSTTESEWTLVTDDCAPCGCLRPAYDGTQDCESAHLPCNKLPTTTSSTTTTPACPQTHVVFRWCTYTQTWYLNNFNCGADVDCKPPNDPTEPAGSPTYWWVGNDSVCSGIQFNCTKDAAQQRPNTTTANCNSLCTTTTTAAPTTTTVL